MIDCKDKKNCCGCSACFSICPKNAISFKYDKEGFRYPNIDKNLCTNCKLCEKICPFINNPVQNNKEQSNEELIEEKINDLPYAINCYVCYNNDVEIRKNSTSGGFFSAIADYVINNKGCVCGAAYDIDNEICHRIVNKKEELKQLRGSKYVQSNQKDTLKRIKKELDDNRLVLYSGTPCQVEGLLNYLQKPYDNLITVDLVCHGVGSEKYWDKYKKYMEWKYGAKIKTISFREKTYGYNSSCMAVYFENGRNSKKGHSNDKFLLPFFSDYILRPSCYFCKIKKLDRKSDFTMGDFWNSDKLPDSFKKSNGCTFITCNSNKANKIFTNIKDNITFQNISLKEGLIINSGKNYSMMLKSTNMPGNRDDFFEDLEKTNYKDISKLLKKYIPLTIKEKIACIVKPILYKLKILELVKKVIK